MFITKGFVEKIGSMYNQKPCNDGYKWFVKTFPKGGEHEEVFRQAIDDGVIKYCTWSIANLMPKEKNVEWAIWCAEQALPIFEAKYPNDNRSRKAIEAAKSWLNNHCEETRKAALAAEAEAAKAALAAEAEAVAAWTAEDAAAAWTAEKAAEAAENAAWAAAAWTAEDAAAAAENAAWAARAASKANQDLVMKILQKGFEIWRTK